MGFLSRAFGERKAVSDPLSLWQEMLRQGTATNAGVSVNLETALKVAVLFACLRKIANGVAQVPLKIFQMYEDAGLSKRRPATEHPLYDTLAFQPNAWTTAFEFMETLTIHAALGNAFAYIGRGLNGKVNELILLNPGTVKVEQDENYRIVYKVNAKNGAVQTFPAEAIWHVRGPSYDGLVGMDILHVAREALGLAVATERSHSELHAKGIRTSGVYSVDGTLDKEKYKQLRMWLEKEYMGSENVGVPMILDRGAKWIQTQMSSADAQHLETRRYEIEEVCRFMDVMPIMVGLSDKTATYASAEQMFIAHAVHTLGPWYRRIEASISLHLLGKKDRQKGLYPKFIAEGLMRGAMKDQAEYFAKALGAGNSDAWMAPDEVRELLELNPMGGDAAKLPKRQQAAAAATGNATTEEGNDNGA